MNERMRACFAIPDICSALALLVGFGDGSANFIILRRCVNQKSQEPIHAFCLHNPTERKSDKKRNDQVFSLLNLPTFPQSHPSRFQRNAPTQCLIPTETALHRRETAAAAGTEPP